MDQLKTNLFNLVALSSDYCAAIENAAEFEQQDLVKTLLALLPRIYFGFLDIEVPDDLDAHSIDEWSLPPSSSSLDEAQYEFVRSRLSTLFAENDTYLETFERDMKYSDTPIASSVSENLSDIYQPLYDFVVEVRESEGAALEEAFRLAQESFNEYWSQTLCNVLRALNALRIS